MKFFPLASTHFYLSKSLNRWVEKNVGTESLQEEFRFDSHIYIYIYIYIYTHTQSVSRL